jgi:hypothetical protein
MVYLRAFLFVLDAGPGFQQHPARRHSAILQSRYKVYGGNPAPTIEPGVKITIRAAPGAIQLRQDPGEQAAWQESELLVESAIDKSREAIINILEDASNPTGAAIIACANSAYEIGHDLSDQGESVQEIQSQLPGINKGTKECAEKIEAAQEERERADKTPALTLDRVADEAHEDPEWEEAGHLVSEAHDFERDILRLHE